LSAAGNGLKLEGVSITLAMALTLLTAVTIVVALARRREARRPAAPAQAPAGPPIERLAADLRRLRKLLEMTENRTDQPGKYLRCRAVHIAYVDVLTSACRELEVQPPDRGVEFAPQTEIYRVESELRRRGLDVRSA
jgi:hypothetical protein